MYYRREGEPQINESPLTSYKSYYKEDFELLSPTLTDTQRYMVYAVIVLILAVLGWCLYKQYGHKMRGGVSMFY
jgi:hypothetical protein